MPVMQAPVMQAELRAVTERFRTEMRALKEAVDALGERVAADHYREAVTVPASDIERSAARIAELSEALRYITSLSPNEPAAYAIWIANKALAGNR